MRSLKINNLSYKDKINNNYNLKYGYNLFNDENDLSDYDRYFKTKNNLNVHENIKR